MKNTTPSQLSADVAFAVQESVRHARTLPLSEASRFLRGFLALVEDDAHVTAVRSVYARLSQCDEQLELIAGPQPKLPLNQP